MLRLPRAFILSLVIIGLNACAATQALHEVMVGARPERESQSVPPGKRFSGPILNITAPSSEGWQLLKSDPSGMAFARRGSAPGESFAAQVVIFDPPQTNSPEEFEALIVKGIQADAETERFRTKSFT